MSDDQTGPNFVQREPVVTAGLSVSGAVALAYGIMELCQAYDWQQFTAAQSKAIIGLVVLASSIGGSLLASQKVTPETTVAQRVAQRVAEALATPVPDDFVEGAEIAHGLATSSWSPPPWPTDG